MAGPSCSSVAWSESPSHRSKRRSHSAWLSSASWSYRSDIRWQHCCTSACSRILSLSLSLSWIRLLLSIDWIDSHSSWPILLGYSFISILFLCLAQVPVLQSFSSAYLPAFLYGQPTLYSSNSAWWEWWPVLLELAALMALFWFTCHWRRMFEIKSFIETTCLPAHGEAALDLDAIRKRPPYQGVTYDFNNRVVNMVPEHYYAIREVFSGHGWKLAFVAYMMAALLTPSLTSLVLLVYLFVIGTYLPGQWVTRALPVLLFYSAIWLAVQSIYQIDFGAIEVRHYDGHPHAISHRLTLNGCCSRSVPQSSNEEILSNFGLVVFNPSVLYLAIQLLPITLMAIYFGYHYYAIRAAIMFRTFHSAGGLVHESPNRPPSSQAPESQPIIESSSLVTTWNSIMSNRIIHTIVQIIWLCT